MLVAPASDHGPIFCFPPLFCRALRPPGPKSKCPDSENAELYSPSERSELLFRLLQHLVLGGPMNQYEDNVGPYLEAAKLLYKQLLTVQKGAAMGALEVMSVVYKVTRAEGATHPLFPSGSKQNFCYLGVDPMRRQVTVLYSAYQSFW